MALARTLDKHHALAVFGADEVLHLLQDEEVGLFSVNKDITWDRLIMNPTVVNSRMHSYSSASKRLSPGWLLSLLYLKPNEGGRFHAADLSDLYHSFVISRKRAFRNRFRARFSHADLVGFSSVCPSSPEPLLLGLNTLAMGDNLAAEIAQSAHTGLLQKTCGAMLEHEVLQYHTSIPRIDHAEALSIDDHISLQRLPLSDLKPEVEARDSQVFALACSAYEGVGLRRNEKKDQIAQTAGVILGVELIGRRG